MTMALEGGEGSASRPGERPGTHCAGGWVGPRGWSGQVRKISPPPGFDPRTIQPVASRYTDYGTRPLIIGKWKWLFMNGCKYKSLISTMVEFLNCCRNRTLAVSVRGRYVEKY
jgi:hypothetical protein